MYEQKKGEKSSGDSQPSLDHDLLRWIGIVKAGASGDQRVDRAAYDLAFREIESRCSSLLSNCVKRFDFLDGIDKEDLMQIARLGLLEAVKDYCPSNPYFFCFCQLILRRFVYRALKRDIHLWEQLAIVFHDELPDESVSYQVNIDRFLTETMVRDAILQAGCSELEKEVLECHLEGMCLSDIEERMGRTYKSVEMARRRAINKLETVLRSQNWR
jgi:RNA polymerase sigma factor (sigma-70 family)